MTKKSIAIISETGIYYYVIATRSNQGDEWNGIVMKILIWLFTSDTDFQGNW